jgi:hypothetical protein
MQAAAPAFRAVVEELADLDAGGDQLVPAATMSETTRNALAERGAADVKSLPKWTEQQEPGGVNWTKRKSSPAVRSALRCHPILS